MRWPLHSNELDVGVSSGRASPVSPVSQRKWFVNKMRGGAASKKSKTGRDLIFQLDQLQGIPQVEVIHSLLTFRINIEQP